MKKVLVVMGSKSDWEVVSPCCTMLEQFGAAFEARVCSAHRTPELAAELARGARNAGFGVIVAAAGKAAHLAGVFASWTALPVIGLPVKSSTMDGLDSLLSTVQMPSGVPVATVAINGAENAGLLAVQILAVDDDALYARLMDYKRAMAEKVMADDNGGFYGG